ncbi:MAG: hypothetical protein RLY21_61 [Planctomycetota bacterium]|jgi:hypothetical protein
MNRLALSLAIASAALATQTSSAASFLGNAVAGGVIRVVNSVTQNTLVAQFPSLPVKVTMCDGTTETPLFVVTGAATAQANGSTYFIRATILGADRTRFEIVHTNASNNGLKRIVLGGGQQSIAFDQTMPNPGTSGSFSGRNVSYIAGGGVWGVTAIWGNAIRRSGLAVQGDLYNTMTLDFNACFDAWDSLIIETDTDMVS